jgi:hypothetical protein
MNGPGNRGDWFEIEYEGGGTVNTPARNEEHARLKAKNYSEKKVLRINKITEKATTGLGSRYDDYLRGF